MSALHDQPNFLFPFSAFVAETKQSPDIITLVLATSYNYTRI
jgi:hypothetical protein